MTTEMVEVASIIELKCGCGAGWQISGLLASSDLTGVVADWERKGHTHTHEGEEVTVVETRMVTKKEEK